MYGKHAAALVTFDDFCPLSAKDYDYGGNTKEDGIIESFFINHLLANYPFIKVNLFTIANNRMNPLNPYDWLDDNTCRLSQHNEWIQWIKNITNTYSQIVLGYHGWQHVRTVTNTSDEFQGYETKELTYASLDSMKKEFNKVKLPVEPVFRPPGWGINPWLLDWLADHKIILGDNPNMTTASDPIKPSWYRTNGKKKLLRIPITGHIDMDDVILKNGCYILHFHFTEPNENSISRQYNRDSLISTVDKLNNKYGDKIAWLSYNEIGNQFRRIDSINYSISGSNKELLIQTKNKREDLEGISFVADAGVQKVLVIDESNSTLAPGTSDGVIWVIRHAAST